jgi:tyrosyl-tRNA synthetase
LPYDFYQYWINVDDADVERLLRLYTFLPDSRIEELTREKGAALRQAKRILAREVTALTHGKEAMEGAAEASHTVFGSAHFSATATFKADPTVIDNPNIPTTVISSAEVAAGVTLAELFVRADLVPSRREARRKAAEGALWLDEARIENADEQFRPNADVALLRLGRKRYRRVRIVP